MFDWLWKMTKTKDDRQFEVLDERLIDIQGKLKNLTVGEDRLINALNGIGAGLRAIALALSTPQDNQAAVQAEIDKLTAELNSSTAKLKGEIDQQTKEK